MTKLRRNHAPGGRGQLKLVRIILLIGVLVAFVVVALQFARVHVVKHPDAAHYSGVYPVSSTSGNVIDRVIMALSYLEAVEQAEWVYYKVARQQKGGRVTGVALVQDPDVDTESADPQEYMSEAFKRSGYRVGWLVDPHDFADMDSDGAKFYTSIVSPMDSALLAGHWQQLAHQTTRWGQLFDSVFVITGPIFKRDTALTRINSIAIPTGFYRIVYRYDGAGMCFVMNNGALDQGRSLREMSVPLDSLQELVDFTLRPSLLDIWHQGDPEEWWQIN